MAKSRSTPPREGEDIDDPIDALGRALSRLPGLTRKTAARIARHLLQDREAAMTPLLGALQHAHTNTRTCSRCGNIGFADPCRICSSPHRDQKRVCVVATIEDLHAIEASGAWHGLYQVIGRSITESDFENLDAVPMFRIELACGEPGVEEICLALPLSVEGQNFSALLASRLEALGPRITSLAVGIPLGADVDKLDEATLGLALRYRRERTALFGGTPPIPSE